MDLTANARVTSGRIEILVLDQGAGVRNAGKLSATASDFILNTSGDIAQTGGQIQAADRVRIQGASFSQTEGSLVSAGSNVRIDAAGDINNAGGTIRGGARNYNDTETPYAVMLNAGGAIDHRSAVGGALAVIFGGNDDVGLFATGDINSVNARIVSNGRLTLHADGDVRNQSLGVAGAGRAESNNSGLLTRSDGYSVQLGSLVDPAHQGYWVSDGDLVVKGRNVSNVGANVFSNNGSVRVTAAQAIDNEALLTGGFDYRRSCFLFLCRRNASTTEAIAGGQISGASGITLTAGQSILNDGGSVLGIGDIILYAPRITARAKSVHQLISRAEGVKAAFGDTWAGIMRWTRAAASRRSKAKSFCAVRRARSAASSQAHKVSRGVLKSCKFRSATPSRWKAIWVFSRGSASHQPMAEPRGRGNAVPDFGRGLGTGARDRSAAGRSGPCRPPVPRTVRA